MGHDAIGVGRGRHGVGVIKQERISVVRDQSSIVVHCTSHERDTKQSGR